VKIKLIITILLLVFVAASLVAVFMRGSEESKVEKGAELAAETNAEAGDSKIIVYYFHGNARCKTCLTIEMYALEAVETGFPEALKANRIDFLTVNLDLAENEHFIDDFQLAARIVVLERIVDGKRKDYVNLTRVWELVGDKKAYVAYVQDEMKKFMNGES
jgi:hypothetical protein